MSKLASWFRDHSNATKRARFVDDALVTGHLAPYAWYRLRYYVLRCACVASIHLAEIAILSAIFAPRVVAKALLLRIATGFVANWWWGGLEAMRTDIRHQRRTRHAHRIAHTFGTWMSIAMVVALVAFGVFGLWVAWDVGANGQAFDAFHLYVLANGLRLALAIVTRTLHSGVYALRRIYRPLWSLIVVDWIGFAAIVVLWPWFGRWAFPVLIFGSTILRSALTIHYARSSAESLGLSFAIWPLRLPTVFRLRARLLRGKFLGAAFSYGMLANVDAILLLGAFWNTDAASLNLFLFYYLIRPFLQSCSDWLQTFYFDLKRFDVSTFANNRIAFRSLLLRLAGVSAALNWVLVMSFGSLFLPDQAQSSWFVFAAIFATRAFLGEAQLRAYADERFGALSASGLIIAVGAVGMNCVHLSPAMKLAGFAGWMIVARLMLCKSREGPRLVPVAHGAASPFDWIRRLKLETAPVRIRSIRLASHVKEGLLTQFCSDLAMRLKPRGGVCLAGRRRVIWWDQGPGERNRQHDDRWIWRRGAGLIEEFVTRPTRRDGAEAVSDASLAFFDRVAVASGSDIELLAAQFRDEFPQGIACLLRDTSAPLASSLPVASRRSIMAGLVQYWRNCHRETMAGHFDVTALLRGDEVRLVFLIDRTANRRERQRWRKRVNDANIAAALGMQPCAADTPIEGQEPASSFASLAR